MTQVNTPAPTVAVIDADVLAKALPVVQTKETKSKKSGLVVASTETHRPMNRKEFKEKFGLSNSDAKRLWAAHNAAFASKAQMGVTAAFEAGFMVTSTKLRKGQSSETLHVTMKKRNSVHETKNETIARLQAELEVMRAAKLKSQLA